MNARKAISSPVVKQLLARSGNRCAFTDCTEKIFTDDHIYVGNFCHINAVNKGKRYDAALSEEYINSYDNLMVMCPRHHKEIDTDEDTFTVTVLKEMKQTHEQGFTAELTISAELVLDAMEKGFQQLVDLLYSMNSSVQHLESMVTDLHRGFFKGVQSMDLSEQLKDLKPLKKSGKHKAVLELLFNYQTKYADTLTDEFRYKINLNIGMTYFDLNDNVKAGEYLVGLKGSPFEGEFKDSSIAIGYMVKDDRENAEKYARIALGKNEKDINAAIVLIECDVITTDQLNSEVLEKLEVQLSVGKALERKNDYKGAVEIYEQVLRQTALDSELTATVNMLLSLALYSSIKQPEHLLLGKIGASEIAIITRCYELMDAAVKYYEATDLLESKCFLITNRGIFEKLLGKRDEAEKSFQYSLQIKKSYFTYKHLLILYIPSAKMLKVISEARELNLSNEDKLELLLIEGEFFLSNNQMDDCLSNLRLAAELVQNGMLVEEYYYTVLFEYLVAKKDYSELEKQLTQIEHIESLTFLHLFYSIHVASLESGSDLYNTLCDRAIRMIRDTAVPLPNRVSLGRFFFAIGDYGHAIEVIKPLVNKETYQPLSYDLIFSFYKEGRYLEAVEWAMAYLDSGQADDRLIDGLSTIYADSGLVKEAVIVLQNFLSVNTNNFLTVKLCVFECSLRNYAEAATLLNQLKDISKFNLDVQFQIALAYKLSGQVAEGDRIAYSIRTAHYHKQDAHHKYIGYVMNQDTATERDAFPDIVGIDCYVALTSEGNPVREFIICDIPVLPIEISAKEPLAQFILGKKLHDNITIEKISYQISSIMTKTMHAVNESLHLMINRFTNTGYQQFEHSPDKTPEENLQPIFNFIDQQTSTIDRIKEFYRNRSATIGALSMLFRENVIHSWQRLVSNDGLELYWQSALDNAILLDFCITGHREVIVDITSLLTMYQNDQFANFDKIENQKYVAASSIDIIDQHLEELRKDLQAGGHFSVHKTANGYERIIYTKEMIEKRIEYVTTFKNAILSRCETLMSPISNNYFQKRKWDEVLGVSFNDTMEIAQERNLLVLSEDALFRELCRNEKGITGFSNFMLLEYLFKKSRITKSEWEQAILKIIQLNYRSVPVTGDILYASLDADGFNPGITMEKAAVSLIDEPRLPVKAGVTADFLKTLYVNSQLMDKRDTAAVWIITRYFRKNTNIFSKTALEAEIDKRFTFLQPQSDRVKELITRVQMVS